MGQPMDCRLTMAANGALIGFVTHDATRKNEIGSWLCANVPLTLDSTKKERREKKELTRREIREQRRVVPRLTGNT